MLLSHCFNETAKVKEKYKHAPGCVSLFIYIHDIFTEKALQWTIGT